MRYHGVGRVVDQVDEDLRQPHLASTGKHGAIRGLPVQPHIISPQTGSGQLHRRIDHLCQIDPPHRFALVAGKSAQVLDDTRCPRCQLRDSGQVLSCLVGLSTFQKGLAVLRKLPDRHQWLVQFVADACAHLAQRRQLARLHQILLRLFERRLGFLPFDHLMTQRLVGARQFCSPGFHPPLQRRVGFGQHCPALHCLKQQGTKSQEDGRHCGRLQRGQPPRWRQIHQCHSRHTDIEQGLFQIQRTLGQVWPPVEMPDHMPP